MPSTIKTVLLTGISGFIAKRIARDLLARGYAVRGSLRSMGRADEVRAAVGDGPLDFVELDLTRDDGWEAAMEGVDALIHTASPFPIENPKHPDELIRPAVDGTLRALRAAHGAGVRRVVLTSSMVAIMQVERPRNHKFTGRDWTDLDHPTAAPYHRSKTLAERAAWDFVKAHPGMHLTAVNPGLVVGTPMDAHTGASLSLIERVMAAKDPMQPDLQLPVVDIADVADLHIRALEQDATIGHRLLATADMWTLPEIAELLAQTYPQRGIKTRTAPRWLLSVLQFADPQVKAVMPALGRKIAVDTTATRDLTGIDFVPGREALLAAAAWVAARD
ncbi:MAG: NAD-dependent epimerase/dehydratase family protein [Shimia sp.]